MSDDQPPRCGDVVFHRPTEEEWIVAYVDEGEGRIAWAGYPAGLARLADCDLRARATDAMHLASVQHWRDQHPCVQDPRRAKVLRLYGTPEERAA